MVFSKSFPTASVSPWSSGGARGEDTVRGWRVKGRGLLLLLLWVLLIPLQGGLREGSEGP